MISLGCSALTNPDMPHLLACGMAALPFNNTILAMIADVKDSAQDIELLSLHLVAS